MIRRLSSNSLLQVRCFSINHYKVLGLKQNCSVLEVKRAYRELAKTSHPDVNPSDPEMFLRITRAVEVLSNPHSRIMFDNEIGYSSEDNKEEHSQEEATMAPSVMSTQRSDSTHFRQKLRKIPKSEKERLEMLRERSKTVLPTSSLYFSVGIPFVGLILWANGFTSL